MIIHPDYWSDKTKHGNAYDLALIQMDKVKAWLLLSMVHIFKSGCLLRPCSWEGWRHPYSPNLPPSLWTRRLENDQVGLLQQGFTTNFIESVLLLWKEEWFLFLVIHLSLVHDIHSLRRRQKKEWKHCFIELASWDGELRMVHMCIEVSKKVPTWTWVRRLLHGSE